ncbi:MAG: acireductone synthase [Gammaproteobacteria bacterium]|nr:acireductone synthase [Gammaproteobacteria bacterium]
MIQAIVTDIEGTTSSLSFVKDVLFPYARARMAEFVRAHAGEPAMGGLLDDVRRMLGGRGDDEKIIAQLIQWIDEDKKVTPLKALQGMIWETGFKQGDFKGHVYEDAVRKLKEWHAQGIKLYVFSSGSVQAQKLLFAHTEYGDLTPLFSGHFDTTMGAKKETSSYHKIAQTIGFAPGDILFLSDIKEELDAAHEAGMQTIWLLRDSAPEGVAAHGKASSFDGIIVKQCAPA